MVSVKTLLGFKNSKNIAIMSYVFFQIPCMIINNLEKIYLRLLKKCASFFIFLTIINKNLLLIFNKDFIKLNTYYKI